jgi:predicted aspartyl protease
LEQLNRLCGTKHDIYFGTRILRRQVHVEAPDVEIIDDRKVRQMDIRRNSTFRSKVLNHFIKGKISLSLMETILVISGELESLESLVKLAWKKYDEKMKSINLTKIERSIIVCKINIHKNHHGKMLHLLVEINNKLVERLVDINASMFVMSVALVQELGLVHLVSRLKSYKIA